MDDRCEPFIADCAVRLATDLMAHRWDPVVLLALRSGRRRRVELVTVIGEISDKVLTEALRRLTANGLVTRDTADDRAITYGLSELGASLANGPMAALGQWAVEHGEQVLAAQERNRGAVPA
jgi:DNA-binding HxlR family transcriptional regulator